LALFLLLGFAVVVLWPEPPTVCYQEVVRGTAGVVTLCEPLRLTDPRVVLYLVLVAAVVLPDLLAQVTRLRFRRLKVRELAAETAELRAELAAIRQEAAALSESLVGSRPEQRRG
jgi:hypothetical protein